MIFICNYTKTVILLLRHFLRACFTLDISLLAVVWLSALPLILPCCTFYSPEFQVWSVVPDKESSVSLIIETLTTIQLSIPANRLGSFYFSAFQSFAAPTNRTTRTAVILQSKFQGNKHKINVIIRKFLLNFFRRSMNFITKNTKKRNRFFFKIRLAHFANCRSI